jgi:hypothetical protein
MKKSLLLFTLFAPLCLSAEIDCTELSVSIYKKPFWFSNGLLYLKTVSLPLEELSDETTIAELKQNVLAKADMKLKKRRTAILQNQTTRERLEDNRMCRDYNLQEIQSLSLTIKKKR